MAATDNPAEYIMKSMRYRDRPTKHVGPELVAQWRGNVGVDADADFSTASARAGDERGHPKPIQRTTTLTGRPGPRKWDSPGPVTDLIGEPVLCIRVGCVSFSSVAANLAHPAGNPESRPPRS